MRWVMVIIVTLITVAILIGLVCCRYSQQSAGQATSSAISNETWYKSIAVKVDYTVIDDPKVLSTVREFIKAQLPLPTNLNRDEKGVVDWLKVDIAVLRVVVELINNGDRSIYYRTNAFCEVYFNATAYDHGFKPIVWRVENPITLPKIVAVKGQVFPLVISCTLDLGYRKVLPKTRITNEFYYIVIKPFKGVVKAEVIVCPKPFGNECRRMENYTSVHIINAEPSRHFGNHSLAQFFKFKILHGSIVDDFVEVSGAYYVFLNMRSFREDFAPWLVYMALTRDFDWWAKGFSDDVAKAVKYVKKVFQENCIPSLGPENLSQYRKEIAAAVHEWWFANLWRKVIGACVPPFYIEVMMGNDVYAVFSTPSRGCIEQYKKVLRLGGRFDLTVIWVSNELKPVQGDFKTVPGWSSIYSLDSGIIKKLLKVIELSGLWNKTWISISILSAGYNVGGQPVSPNIPDYQYYNTSMGVNVKDVVNELISRFPDTVKLRLPPSKTDAIVFVRLTHLSEVLKLLESKGVKIGVPTNAIVIFG